MRPIWAICMKSGQKCLEKRNSIIFTHVGLAEGFKFESWFEPLLAIWQSLPKAIPDWEDNRLFWLQNQWQSFWGYALAQLRLVWLASTKLPQMQGVSWSAAVAACQDLLASGKSATTLALLTQFVSQKIWILWKFGQWILIFFHGKWPAQPALIALRISNHN